MVEHMATLRDTLPRAASVQMLSMMCWSINGCVEETEQDSPAVMSSTYVYQLGAEEATCLTIARETAFPTLVPWGTPQGVGV